MSINVLVTRLNTVLDNIDLYENSDDYVDDDEILRYITYLETVRRNLTEYASTFKSNEVPEKIINAIEAATNALEERQEKYTNLREGIIDNIGGRKRIREAGNFIGDGEAGNLNKRMKTYLSETDPSRFDKSPDGFISLLDDQVPSVNKNVNERRKEQLFIGTVKPIFLKNLLISYASTDLSNTDINDLLRNYLSKSPWMGISATDTIPDIVRKLLFIIEEVHTVPHLSIFRTFSLQDPTKTIKEPVFTPLREVSTNRFTAIPSVNEAISNANLRSREALENLIIALNAENQTTIEAI